MIVKNAIENIFVYSFSLIMNMGDKLKRQLHALCPMYLYTAYVQQLQKSGIYGYKLPFFLKPVWGVFFINYL